MIEWCYQGDNPEFIEKHYKWEENDERNLKWEVRAKLIENLWKIWFCWINTEKKQTNIGDAKDAEYFMNL
jgi:hypothetical protein